MCPYSISGLIARYNYYKNVSMNSLLLFKFQIIMTRKPMNPLNKEFKIQINLEDKKNVKKSMFY